jgi:ribosome-associated protein
MLTPLEMAQEAIKVLDAKKAENIRVLETHDVSVLADYFVICTATSTTHIKTLSDEVDKALSDKGEQPLRTEGYRSGGWVLVDFGCLVVHIFTDEARKFYNLEHLWSDAPQVDISALLTE